MGPLLTVCLLYQEAAELTLSIQQSEHRATELARSELLTQRLGSSVLQRLSRVFFQTKLLQRLSFVFSLTSFLVLRDGLVGFCAVVNSRINE